MIKISKKQLKEFRQPPDGFLEWLNFCQFRIISPQNKLIPFELQDFQKDMFRNSLSCDENGNYKYKTIIYTMPRRHSKTICAALVVLYRFSMFPNENIKVISNSEAQCLRVNFKAIRDLIVNSEFLSDWIGIDNIKRTEIDFPDFNSKVQAVVGNLPSLYGERISCGWFSELHAAGDDEGLQILSSSQGDVKNSFSIIDSTTDPEGGPLHQLENAASKDATIYTYRKEYSSLKDAKKNSPWWIDRNWLDSRQKQLAPEVFGSQHLNKRSEATNKLFQSKDIKAAVMPYKAGISKAEIESLMGGKKYTVGIGLDRAKANSVHADKTVLTCVARSVGDDGEPTFYLLDQKIIPQGYDKAIKKEIVELDGKYGLTNAVFESYNVQDLVHWMFERNYSCEDVHPTSKAKTSAYINLAQIIRERRISIPKDSGQLQKEAEKFSYTVTPKGNMQFGNRGYKDDCIDSLCWSVYALRHQDIVIYELNDILCNSKNNNAVYCYLRNGNYVLHCSKSCQAHKQVVTMYKQYLRSNPDSELNIQNFFQRLVKVQGIISYNSI